MTEYNPKNKHHQRKNQQEFIKALKHKFTDDKPVDPPITFGDGHVTLIPYAKPGEP